MISKAYNDDNFKAEHRKTSKDFTRTCKFTLPSLIELILSFSNHSLQTELNQYFKIKQQRKVARQYATDGGFVKARKKFSASAFVELLQVATQAFYQEAKIQTWYGFRVLAVDGSKYSLPNTPDVFKAFGGQDNQFGRKLMALGSCLYDVYQGLVLDATLVHYSSSERDLAFGHLQHTSTNDLILYDRGYSAYWLALAHIIAKRDFCMRIRSNFNKQTIAFGKSSKRDAVIILDPSDEMIAHAKSKGLSIETVTVRLLKIKTTKGEYLLMTTLLDNTHYPRKDFAGLYHMRWQIEEAYKTQKCRFEVENFSGESVLSLQQDYHACMLNHVLTAISCYYAQGYINKRVSKRKLAYKINFSKAISSVKDVLVNALNDCLLDVDMRQSLQAISKNLTAIRSGRSFERVKVRCRRPMLRKGYRYA